MVKVIESKVCVPGRPAAEAGRPLHPRGRSGLGPVRALGCGARPGGGDEETLERGVQELHVLAAPGFPSLQSPALLLTASSNLAEVKRWRGPQVNPCLNQDSEAQGGNGEPPLLAYMMPCPARGVLCRRARPEFASISGPPPRGSEAFQEALVTAGDKLVVVDFSATWCGPCKMIKPFYHSLSEKYSNVVFLEVDVDDCQDVAAECEVKCMPTFQFYKKGQKVGEFSGANKEKLEASITEFA
ncbi:thioredoxin [Sigmodon hispidus]